MTSKLMSFYNGIVIHLTWVISIPDMYAYVARQPILNRQQRTVGYELLFRDGERNAFPQIEANTATSRLLVENYMAVGDDLATASQRTFINFPHDSLIKLMPLLLPRQKVVIEVLETCTPDDELFSAIRHLNKQGYTIALDDYELDPAWQRFMPYVHLIKLDFIKLGCQRACEFVAQQKSQRLKFLAEKVETREEFEAAKSAGFHLFQGYYFSKPELLKNRQVTPETLTTLRLLREISQSPVDFQRVERIISSDVSLSYLLLRYVNSAAHRTLTPIGNFKQALVYLGEEKVKLFVSVVAAAHASIHKPRELYVLSLQRARMCEELARCSGVKLNSDQAFLAGIFSLLDALLDKPLPKLLELLPLSENVQIALLKREGELGDILNLLDAYDNADWEVTAHYCEKLGVKETQVASIYHDTLHWLTSYQIPYQK
ncbi:EAL and HDOD domain-containing protein [Photobacterium sp. 1_MG-2023]|uniref:EAL and HDOD domain-containing protein n=1 Tax=Photobacterium sp. 1_MG-2023 TaxID=3062646 RepID=UPI0026E3E9A1|nr:HDOD domain-containing protein [Photobacterium sp. 1_MG-2023]MDO6708516.1 HDOD domain-containing protein [Photobacterium sp. 1_MG-2023]